MTPRTSDEARYKASKAIGKREQAQIILSIEVRIFFLVFIDFFSLFLTRQHTFLSTAKCLPDRKVFHQATEEMRFTVMSLLYGGGYLNMAR